jgi:hypothetical protein
MNREPPAASRNRRRPKPGRPLGKVEYKRCKTGPLVKRIHSRHGANDSNGRSSDGSFEGQPVKLKLGDSALEAELHRVRAIAGP